MDNNDYVTLEVGELLREKRFDEYVDSMYGNSYRIRDEIKEKYPGLSDDGYVDLLRENGGTLTHKELFGYYKEPIHIACRNTEYYFKNYSYMICARPTLYEAQKWFREKFNIDVVAIPYVNEDMEKQGYYCYPLKDGKSLKCDFVFSDNFEDCLNRGLKEAVKYI